MTRLTDAATPEYVDLVGMAVDARYRYGWWHNSKARRTVERFVGAYALLFVVVGAVYLVLR